jgi:hypothetical protein
MAGPAISDGLLILILVSGAVSFSANSVSPLTRLCHSTAYSPGAGAIAKYRGFVPATTSGPSGCVNVRILPRQMALHQSLSHRVRPHRASPLDDDWVQTADRLHSRARKQAIGQQSCQPVIP